MSTDNIGFDEDLTKIIFELSSNIIKYAPYFFCCTHLKYLSYLIILIRKCKVLENRVCACKYIDVDFYNDLVHCNPILPFHCLRPETVIHHQWPAVVWRLPPVVSH